jgi:predicted DNA-binding protein
MPRKSKNTKCLWVYLNGTTLESLRKLSTNDGKSMSEYVRKLVEDEVWTFEHYNPSHFQVSVNGEEISNE